MLRLTAPDGEAPPVERGICKREAPLLAPFIASDLLTAGFTVVGAAGVTATGGGGGGSGMGGGEGAD
jgi:hypothetical protein